MRQAITMALCAGLLALGAMAQDKPDEKQYEALMKRTGKAVGAIKAASAAKDHATVGQEAAQLQEIFTQVEKFWVEHKTEDAIKWSKEAQEAAQALSTAAKAGQDEQVATAFQKLTSNCGGCHTAHREKLADGTYRIKY